MLTLWEHIDALHSAYDRFTSSVCKKYGLKHAEFNILIYLHDHPDESTATDIVRKENLSKSHVSISLRALEERKLVIGEFQGSNRRTIYLRLTDLATQIVADGLKAREEFARTMLDGFSEAEMQAFFTSLSKVKKNVFAYAKAQH
ncbi:MAG: winged helix-turn-helix transcriptional regulator [Clostridia bacterium]|nr:winged helix-turn-helix transcriptional regulator [Clostridia bacterium]